MQRSPTHTQKTSYDSWGDFLRALWHFLGHQRRPYLAWTVVLFLVQGYSLVPPLIVGGLVDFFVKYRPGGSLQTFYVLCAGSTISYALATWIRITAKKHLARYEVEAVYNAKTEGFARLMDFSLTWHNQESSGNKVQRILNGVEGMRLFLMRISSSFFRTFNTLMIVFVVYALRGWQFLLFIAIYLMITGWLEWYFYRRVLGANNALNRATEKSSGTYFESASNVLTIKTLGVKATVGQIVNTNEANARKHSLKTRTLNINKWLIFQNINAVAFGVVIFLLGRSYLDGIVTAGAIVVYFTYFNQMRETISDASEIISELIENKSRVTRMMPIYWTGDPEHTGTQAFPAAWHELRLEEAGFEYGAGENGFAIKHLNLKIARGQAIGIVGHSGSGKSTLAKLLLGVYQLRDGRLSFDDTSVYDIEHTQLTNHISTVLQETELFNLTLRENLTLTKQVPKTVLDQAVAVAQLEAVIERLPKGLETLIGEKGYRLSGGERQRVGIARAICSGAEILVLDEATSALDSETEARIQAGLESLGEKTLIIIAHRLSTLAHTDRIYVFEHGTVVEHGRFHELAAVTTSRFHQLYELQRSAGQD